jgi:predicted CXXCH cytochrome family protein
MRKIGLSIVVIAALALVPAISWAAITGTPHDLSAKGWGTDQICIFCHTPHNAITPQLAPLWNHTSTTASYTLYTSSSLNATMAQPLGVSKACLSCHDGTVALDSYGGATGTHNISTGLLGTDLSDDHPVSFTFDAALASADGGLVTPASTSWVDAGQTVPLFATKLECASCHDVHDNTNEPFLVMGNSASALCLTCHTK